VITETIQKLRAGGLFKKVAGVADVERAMANLLADPAAFVMPLAESAGESEGYFNAEDQEVTAVVGVLMAVRSLQDATGEAAVDALQPYRDAVDAALFGWSPGAEFSEFAYAGGQLIGFNNGVIWWQAEYATTFHKRT
jgi:hypothetical protein